MSQVPDDPIQCPRKMTQQQWSAYKARILREARKKQAATVWWMLSRLLAMLARPFVPPSARPLHEQKLERQ